MSDRLRTNLFTIWDRGRYGLSWEDRWVDDFVADLANGERVEPDYEAAATEICSAADHYGDLGHPCHDHLEIARAAVDAAIGDRLLIDPPKEEE